MPKIMQHSHVFNLALALGLAWVRNKLARVRVRYHAFGLFTTRVRARAGDRVEFT